MNLAMILIIGLLITSIPLDVVAHSLKGTYTVLTITATSTWGYKWFKDPETGEPIEVFVELSRTTSTSTSTFESEIPHPELHPPGTDWSKYITAGAALIAAIAAVVTAVNSSK